MVNDRFLLAGNHGFESVDVPAARTRVLRESMENEIPRAPDAAIFSKMPVKLSSMQSLAIYRGLLKPALIASINRNGTLKRDEIWLNRHRAF
ncbi:hypothetical protein [Bradyrhizobium sp. Tv2a-2]|uniref:hypothetical protein n=1 Tax=Bradyrhizobium sp. Tv2a-2 TaxID=113395 RepID=UPI00040C83E3|nr:hypothetical protein [Bradyrhizobium sp. Tv2a-2]